MCDVCEVNTAVSETSQLTLEVLPTDQTGIDIVVRERHRTQLLKVKVQNSTINRVQERAMATQRVLCRT